MKADDIKKINDTFEELSPSDYITVLDRTRPYNGQPWTDEGIRGSTEVKGITFRDIRDCFIRGCFFALGLQPKDYPKSVYDLPWNEMDIIAVWQNTSCWIEKYMGIFPNCKPMSFEDTMEHCPIIEVDLEEGESHE